MTQETLQHLYKQTNMPYCVIGDCKVQEHSSGLQVFLEAVHIYVVSVVT